MAWRFFFSELRRYGDTAIRRYRGWGDIGAAPIRRHPGLGGIGVSVRRRFGTRGAGTMNFPIEHRMLFFYVLLKEPLPPRVSRGSQGTSSSLSRHRC